MTKKDLQQHHCSLCGREGRALALCLCLLVAALGLCACSASAELNSATESLGVQTSSSAALMETSATPMASAASAGPAAGDAVQETSSVPPVPTPVVTPAGPAEMANPTAKEESAPVPGAEEASGIVLPEVTASMVEPENPPEIQTDPDDTMPEASIQETDASVLPESTEAVETDLAKETLAAEPSLEVVPGATVLNEMSALEGSLYSWLEAAEQPVLLTYLDGSEASMAAEPILEDIATVYRGRLLVLEIDLRVMGAPLTSSLATTPTFIIYRSGVQRQSLSGFSSPEELYLFVSNALSH